MRKVLLLGTIFVATSAFAFSGVFGGGSGSSKQATYSGGVNAIGVHFNGKNDTSMAPNCPEHSVWSDEALKCECEKWYEMDEGKHKCEEICSTDRRCGEICCGTGNKCVEDESGKKWCCHLEYEDHGNIENSGMCCDASVSTGFSTFDGECCEGNISCGLKNEAGECINLGCCPSDSAGFGIDMEFAGEDWVCCGPGRIRIPGPDGRMNCCPEGSSGDFDAEGYCCPEGTEVIEGNCCPKGSTSYSDDYGCCGAEGTVILEDLYGSKHCCPATSIGVATRAWRCCEAGRKLIEQDGETYCCPEGSTSIDYSKCY